MERLSGDDQRSASAQRKKTKKHKKKRTRSKSAIDAASAPALSSEMDCHGSNEVQSFSFWCILHFFSLSLFFLKSKQPALNGEPSPSPVESADPEEEALPTSILVSYLTCGTVFLLLFFLSRVVL